MGSAYVHRLAPWFLAAILAASAGADQGAATLYRKGNQARLQGRHVEALLLYSRARAQDPTNPKYLRAAHSVRRGAAQLLAAAGEYRTALEVAPDLWPMRSRDPDEPDDRSARTELGPEPRQLRAPPTLEYRRHQSAFRLRGTIREAYEAVAAEFGVVVHFDESVGEDDEIRADLTECDFACALRALGAVGGTFVVPLEGNRMLVAEDSAAKRTDLETVAFATVPLDAAMAPAAVTEVGQAVQQALDIQRFQTLPNAGAMLLRAPTSKVRMAQALADGLRFPRAEVMITVRLIAVSAGSVTAAGISVPTAYPVRGTGSLFGVSGDSNTAEPLIGIGAGAASLGVSIGDAAALASLNASRAQSVQDMQVRATHGVAAQAKIGERYPIITAQFSGDSRIQSGSGYFQPPPTITTEDLGLNLNVTPWVHGGTAMTLDLELNFRLLAGGAVNGVPIISNREVTTQVRLRSGQFAIVTGMATYDRSRTFTAPAWAAPVPVLGSLLRRSEWRWNRRELLIVVEPRIVRLPPGELSPSRSFLFGAEERPVPPI